MSESRERPILFSSPMVRALLEDRKTQTRRVMRPQPPDGWFSMSPDEVREAGECGPGSTTPRWLVDRCPHGKPGERLWVRESHAKFMVGEGMGSPVPQCVAYRATCDADGGFDYANGRGEVMRLKVTKWTPSIFMPRWASRITLEITEVRVERLWDISDDDARAEGVTPYTPPHGHIVPDQRVPGPGFDRCRLGDQAHRLPFADLWDKINGKHRPMLDDEGVTVRDDEDKPILVAPKAWASNPWVWAITFRRLLP